MTEEVKLKPCPFCGAKAIVRENDPGMWEILCTKCYARTLTGIGADQIPALRERWNRRTEDRFHASLDEALNSGDGSYKP